MADEHAAFFIHFDARAPDDAFRRAKSVLPPAKRIEFLERHACRWGDFGHVLASLKGLRAWLGSEPRLDYAILLTGQDYPLRPPAALRAFFAKHEPASFLHHSPIPYDGFGSEPWPGGGLSRIEAWHFWPLGRHVPFPNRYLPLPIRRRFPAGLHPFAGSGYWALHRSAVEYVLRFVADRPDFVRFYRRVQIPDESFFQTILLNSPLSGEIVNDNLRYIEWPPRGPAVLLSEAFPRIASSGNLFARKFDMTLDSAILEEIDEKLLTRTRAGAQ